MITIDQCYKMMSTLKVCAIKVFDWQDNKLFHHEHGKGVDVCINSLREAVENLSNYPRIVVHGADEDVLNSNWRGAYKWEVLLNGNGKTGGKESTVTNTPGTFGGMPEWMFKYLIMDRNNNSVPAGYVSQDVVALQMKSFEDKLNHLKELQELKKASENNIDKYLPLAGPLLYAMGKPIEEIQKMGNLYSMGKIAGTAEKSPTNTLTFEDVSKLSTEQRNERIEQLLAKLAGKISNEEMIYLFTALDQNRDLVFVAKLAALVPADKLNALIKILTEKPQLADMALNFNK